MPDSVAVLLCMAVGFVSGVLNVVAGGGSFLTLPVLLFLGLGAAEANGTNRVGVLAQNVGGVWGFHRHRVMEWRWGLIVTIPALVGAALGSWAALYIPDFAFRRLLSTVMIVTTVWTLLQNRRHRQIVKRPLRSPRHWTMIGTFFLVGLYGGFLQAGVGFLVLAATTLAGMDLLRGNAIKVLTVMFLTILALTVFAVTGHVKWPLAIALGAGNLAGSWAGVRIAIASGQRWLDLIVTITTIVFAILLWLV